MLYICMEIGGYLLRGGFHLNERNQWMFYSCYCLNVVIIWNKMLKWQIVDLFNVYVYWTYHFHCIIEPEPNHLIENFEAHIWLFCVGISKCFQL